jgi:hypothetical protein
MTTGDSMPLDVLRAAKIHAYPDPNNAAKRRDFIEVFRNPPIFTEEPENIF